MPYAVKCYLPILSNELIKGNFMFFNSKESNFDMVIIFIACVPDNLKRKITYFSFRVVWKTGYIVKAFFEFLAVLKL